MLKSFPLTLNPIGYIPVVNESDSNIAVAEDIFLIILNDSSWRLCQKGNS